MSRPSRLKPLLASLVLFAAAFLTVPPLLADEARTSFNIPAQSLSSALREFARQSNREILFSSEVVQGKSTKGVKGDLGADSALTQLLVGTDLVVTRSANGTTLVTTPDAKEASGNSGPPMAPNGAESNKAPTSNRGQGQKTESLEEVVVTAQKRTERLQDVPIPITVLSGDALLSSNQLRLQDYYEKIPGLSMTVGDTWNANSVTLRGLSTPGTGIPTVGIVVDEVPFTTSTVFGGGTSVPDIDPGEVARLEVLRGPQGTLYGGNTLAGLIKYVTVDPSTVAMSGGLQVGFSHVYHADDTGYNLRGSVNVPLGETLAIRASAFSRVDPGYIDNVYQGVKGINEERVRGGHLSALWRPSDALSLKLNAFFQRGQRDGVGSAQPDYGTYRQNFIYNSGQVDRKLEAYSATLTARVGKGELTSVSGYSVSKFEDTIDTSGFFGAFTNHPDPSFGIQDYGSPYSYVHDDVNTAKFSQEVRLSTPLGSNLDWLVGAFYTHETPVFNQPYYVVQPNGQIIDTLIFYRYQPKYSEYAAFTNFTYKFSKRFDVQIGGRESYMDQPYREFRTGPWLQFFYPVLTDPYLSHGLEAKDHSFTYLLTPRFQVTPDIMVYARLASGFQVSGVNQAYGFAGIPPTFRPAKTQNFDLGMKANFLERRLSIDLAFYRIDWKDVQLFRLTSFGDFYWVNGGQARSEGVELALDAKPWRGMTVALSGTKVNARLTADLPPEGGGPTVGSKGAKLPGTADFSGSFSADQELALAAEWKLSFGASLAYVGRRPAGYKFAGTSAAEGTFPSYTKFDLRGALTHREWTLEMYANNVSNNYAPLNGGFSDPAHLAFFYMEPRTIGANLTRTW